MICCPTAAPRMIQTSHSDTIWSIAFREELLHNAAENFDVLREVEEEEEEEKLLVK